MNNNYVLNYTGQECKEKSPLYKLADPQVGIWEAEKVYPGIGLFNYALSVNFKEEMDYSMLNKALNLIIEKNDGLRLHIVECDDIPKQYVKPYKYIHTDIFDFSSKKIEDIREWMKQRAETPFTLIDTDLFYFAILRAPNAQTALFIKVHHILMDAWSLYNILLNKLTEYYHCLKNNMEIEDSVPCYSNYIAEAEFYKNRTDYKEILNKSKEFWKNEFSTIPGFTVLKPGTGKLESKRKVYKISQELSDKIRLFSSNTGYSPYIIFLSVLSVYICKITSEKDIVVGSIALNRINEAEEKIFGMFVNILPVRINVETNKDFISYLADVKKKWKQVSANQKYALNDITEDYRKKNKAQHKLFDIVLSYQNVKLDTDNMDYECELVENGHQIEALRMHISDRKNSGGFMVEMEYHRDEFTELDIDTIINQFSNILKNVICDNSSVKLCALDMLSDEERSRILEQFNNTNEDYPKDKALHNLFEKQVKLAPESIALIFEGNSLTYRELNEKANSLARVLADRGVKPGDTVGMITERSVEMIIGMLGVLKAGGAYLPLDPTFPEERIGLMLKDSEASLLLFYGGQRQSKIDSKAYNVDYIDLSDRQLYKGDCSNLDINISSGNPAYIIYTSGSTGMPKGVIIEHRSVARTVKNTNYIDISRSDRLLQLSNYAFDGSVFDIYGALLNGAALVLIQKRDIADIARLSDIIKRENVTLFFITTALFNILVDTNLDSLINVRKILVGGERASVEHVRKAVRHLGAGKVINAYGPTETTVFAAYYPINKVEDNAVSIPIGKPLSNTRIYILDEYGNLLPEGVTGELYISGDGVAKGYLNRLELTEEKFVHNPFVFGECTDKLSDCRMYRTGDLGRWLPDGNIEFAGRADKQVKLRGYRIELGEIEACLTAHSAIKEALVIFNEGNPEQKLICAYLVAKKKVSDYELKKHIKQVLPYYMVPSCFVYLDNIPLTSNGKVNIKSLPKPEYTEAEPNYIEPKSKLETLITDAWIKVLGVAKVGVKDDFFLIGGHSLLTMKLVAELKKRNLSLKVTDIYENRTIAKQASLVLAGGGYIPAPEIDPVYELEKETETKSFNIGNIKTDKFKLIKSVVENTDSYTWEELNCFYRPIAIMYEVYGEGYFDIFLFMVGYYSTHMVDGWFTEVFESGIFHEFFEFHENVMKPKTGLSFITESYLNENEMHQKLKGALDENSPVLVPVDLFGLYYTQGYLRSRHRHFIIVKGYDEERGIYHILDNMQLDNGSNTIYKDFCIKAEDLYTMNNMYFEYYYPDIEASHMWVLQKCRALPKDSYSIERLLMDHLQHLRDIENNKSVINYPEYEFLKKISNEIKISMNEATNSFTIFNFKQVYYDLLYKLLKKAGGHSQEISELKFFVRKTSAIWNEIKLAILDAAAGNSMDSDLVRSKINRNISLENKFRLKLMKLIAQLDFGCQLIENSERDLFKLFTVKNYRKAEIIREKEKVVFKLFPHTVYDTWDVQDNAPQLLAHPEMFEDFILEARVKLDKTKQGPYLSGLIVFFENGIKIMFCLDKGYTVSVLCPEKGDSYTLFTTGIPENGAFLRTKKKGSTLSFFIKKDKTESWNKKYEITDCETISSCGIFAKTFEKVKLSAEFSELKYINL